MNELWCDDFEVLHWVIERFKRNGHSIEVGEALRVFPEEQYDSVRESLRRLSTHTYLVTVNGGGIGRSARTEPPVVKDVTERALRVAGALPDNAELLTDRMLAVLIEGAVNEPDPREALQAQGRARGRRRNDPRRAYRCGSSCYRQGNWRRLARATSPGHDRSEPPLAVIEHEIHGDPGHFLPTLLLT